MTSYSGQSRIIKVVLVGSSGVGKTCLITSFLKRFHNINATATVSPSYYSEDIVTKDGIGVCLQIWDTAGQERYYAISSLFFRESEVAIVCYSKNDTTIEATREWISKVKDISPECKIIIAITKSDLLDEKEINSIKISLERLLTDRDSQRIFSTSSVDRREVEELFYHSCEMVSLTKMGQNSIIEKRNNKCC